MKISILTHPLGANYGGILQAFALSTYLKKLGHEVIVLNRQPNLPFLKRLIKSVLMAINHPRYKNPRYYHLINFINKYINYTKPISTTTQMSRFVKKNDINLVIVGSDQVWRKDFAMKYGFNYFLDFVPDGIKKISYAASFGLSQWEYSEEQTDQIKKLISSFNAISIREDEGLILCNNYLGVEAEHVLDPTMLLKVEDYNKITNPRIVKDNYIFVYWLGSEDKKKEALSNIEINKKKIIDLSLRSDRPLISIEDWLSYIKYADYIVTDSFHGCVFSVIFQKQFIVHTNNSGGNGRLNSLFRILNINPASNGIDYISVTKKLELQRNISYNFINRILQ